MIATLLLLMKESMRKLTKEFTRDLEAAASRHSETLRAQEEAWLNDIISVRLDRFSSSLCVVLF